MKNYKIKVIIAFLFISLFPLSLLFGQKKVTYSIFFTPEFSFMKITKPESINFGIVRGNPLPTEPIGGIGFGYAIGGALDFRIKSSFFLRTGFQYEISKHEFNVEQAFGSPFEAENTATINSIGIPFSLVKRTKSNESLISLGILVNVILDEKTSSNGFNNINPAKFSGIFSWEIEKSLSDKLLVGIEPFVRYTPNRFTIFGNLAESKTNFETGIALRVKL